MRLIFFINGVKPVSVTRFYDTLGGPESGQTVQEIFKFCFFIGQLGKSSSSFSSASSRKFSNAFSSDILPTKDSEGLLAMVDLLIAKDFISLSI